MDLVGKSFVQDRQDGEKMTTNAQAGDWTASGGDSSTTGDQSEPTASTVVEGLDRDKFIIRVGVIGCTTFSLNKCSFGSA
jgi:hypothetical protein